MALWEPEWAMGALFTILFSLIITAQSPSFASELGTIGANNSILVKPNGSNVDEAFRPYLDAIGMIVVDQRGACTATHIGNGYVISAGHCFYYGTATGTLIGSGGNCDGVSVKWGFRGTQSVGISHCTEVVYAESSRLRDFAIFKVDHAPKVKIAISTDDHRTPVGTKISIFGHPKQKPLSWSDYCSLRESPPLHGATSGQFLHECDTNKGDSGAPVLAITQNGTVKIVGIHDGEYINPKKTEEPDTLQFNAATFMYDAREELMERGLKLEKVIN